MKEKEKMLAGMIYDPSDPELARLRNQAHNLCTEYNSLREEDPHRKEILSLLFPNAERLYLQGPIQFDYGVFTKFGRGVYANFNFVVLDCAPVEVGDDVYFGCNVSLMTPVHPLLPEERRAYQKEDGTWTDKEYAKPIAIGSNCWIASNVVISGGVHIGEGCVIGAGSVVTRDIPAHCFAAGNPCRVIRKLSEKDSIYLKQGLFPEE